MPSAFPGMDPFLENQKWEDFHATFNTVVRETLSPRLEPRYVVRVERRVYVEGPGDEHEQWRRSVAAVVLTEVADKPMVSGAAAAGTSRIVPVECIVPLPEERREIFLIVRDRETMEVVTVVETLSPANKRMSNGRREYLEKWA